MELEKISHDCPSLDKRAIRFLLSRFFLTSSRRELLRGHPRAQPRHCCAGPVLAASRTPPRAPRASRLREPVLSWPRTGHCRELLARPSREPEHALRPCLSSSAAAAATCRDAAEIGGAHDASQPRGDLPWHAPQPLHALGHLLLLTLSPSPPRGRGQPLWSVRRFVRGRMARLVASLCFVRR